MFFFPLQFCSCKAFNSAYFYPRFGVGYLLHSLFNLATFSLVPLLIRWHIILNLSVSLVNLHATLFTFCLVLQRPLCISLTGEYLTELWKVAVYGQACKHNHYSHGFLLNLSPAFLSKTNFCATRWMTMRPIVEYLSFITYHFKNIS